MKASNFRVSVRIYAMAGLLLAIIISVAGIGIWKMHKIGKEITEIAHRDILLTEIVSTISVHQLEQAVLLAQGTGHLNPADMNALLQNFSALGHKVDAELKQAFDMASIAIEQAATPESRREFESLAAKVDRIAKEHLAYEKHGEETFQLLISGDVEAATAIASETAKEQQELNRELAEVQGQLDRFTIAAALKAEEDEKLGIQLLIGSAIAGTVFGILAAFFILPANTPTSVEFP